jgi:D-alanyl-D-alanine carboxypeptidase
MTKPSPAATENAAPSPTPLDTAVMQQVVDEMSSHSGVPGGISHVWDATAGYHTFVTGKADLATNAPMTPNLNGRMGGSTMTFVSVVALQLVREGKLSLTDPVSKHLPGKIPWGDELTIRNLLSQTSGIEDYLGLPQFAEPDLYLSSGARWKTYRPDQLLAFGVEAGPVVPVGTWNFSYTDFVALGMIIEKITGDTIQHQVTERIITPLKLSRTVFPGTEVAIPFPHAKGYLRLSNGEYTEITELNPSLEWAARGLISNVADLVSFFKGLFVDHALLAEHELADMLDFTPVYAPGPGGGGPQIGVAQGLGVISVTWPGGVTSYGTFGSLMHSYDSLVHVSADRSRVVATMVNQYVNDATQGPVLLPTVLAAMCGIQSFPN